MSTKRKVINASIYLNGIILLILFFPFTGFSQSTPQHIQTYVEQLHQSHSVAAPSALREEKNAKEVIEIAHQYFSDTLSRVRAKMYGLVGEAGVNAKDQSLRQLAVEQLVKASADFENLDLLLSKLSVFKKSDFTQASCDILVVLFRKKPPYLDQLARLVGSLQMTSLKDDLMVLSGPATSYQRIRWAALLALARMGDAEATQSMMKRVQRLPVNDDVVYEVFPDLIYTRQRQAIDYLIVELKNDEKKCTTADAEDETPITCAYRIMELLSPVIEKYPLEVDASGDIKTKDYKKSLTTVRTWFEKNKDYGMIQGN
ncbi:MAG: hypothetical protein ABJH04_01995 [Cyclobacteriaceae bacterium]